MNRERAEELYNRAMQVADNACISDDVEGGRAVRDLGDAFWAYWREVNSLALRIDAAVLDAQRTADAGYMLRYDRTCRPE